MDRLKIVLTVIFAAVIFVFPAYAGVIISSVSERYFAPFEKTTQNTYVEDGRVRSEEKGENTDQIMIYNPDKGVLWVINNKDKTYKEITKDSIEQAKAQMQGMKKAMEEQMKNMPPEMKKIMEGQMFQQSSPAVSVVSYKKIAANEMVGQWVCDRYEGYAEDAKVEDIWTVDWSKVGLTLEEFKAESEMFKFFGESFKGLSGPGALEAKPEQGFSGMPVRTIHYLRGSPSFKTELKQAQHQALAPSLFDLPAGLKKEEAMMMPQMKH